MASLLGLAAYDDSPAGEEEDSSARSPALALSIVDYGHEADEPEQPSPSLGASLDDPALAAAVPKSVGTSGVQVSIVKKPAAAAAKVAGGEEVREEAGAALSADEKPAQRKPFVIPDSPPGEVDPGLAERFANLAQKTREGVSVNQYIRKAKSFRNPNILEKLVAFFEVRDSGTNYPPSIYDPNEITRDDHYDRLEARRREWEERQARKHGERVNFTSGGTLELPASAAPSAKPPRKSKWDSSGSADPAAKRQA